MWSVCADLHTMQAAVFCLYWTVHIFEFGLSSAAETYSLLFVVCLSVLKWTHFSVWSACRGLYVHVAENCLSVLNYAHWSKWSVSQYWTEHIDVFYLSVFTVLYIILCVCSLSELNGTYFLFVVWGYWNVHIEVCGLSICTELYTLLCVVYLSVLNCTNCCFWSI